MTANENTEHLRLLTIFHYVYAGLFAMFSCFPIIHLGVGIAMVLGAFDQAGKETPPKELGYFLIAIAALIMTLGFGTAVIIALAGRCLATRTWHTFVFVVAICECLMAPIGTVLGVFTIIVINKPEVKAIFAAERAGWATDVKPTY